MRRHQSYALRPSVPVTDDDVQGHDPAPYAGPDPYAAPHVPYGRPHEPNAGYGQEAAYDPDPAVEQPYDDGHPAPYPDEPAPYAEPPRRRRGLVAVGAALGVAVLGAAGAYAFRGGGAHTATGEPPVVKADASPTKVAPQNPGGVEIPDQGKLIYERNGQDGQTRVVTREEQPVDVRQAARVASAGAGAVPGVGPAPGRRVAQRDARRSRSAVRTVAVGPERDAQDAGGEPRRVRGTHWPATGAGATPSALPPQPPASALPPQRPRPASLHHSRGRAEAGGGRRHRCGCPEGAAPGWPAGAGPWRSQPRTPQTSAPAAGSVAATSSSSRCDPDREGSEGRVRAAAAAVLRASCPAARPACAAPRSTAARLVPRAWSDR